MQRVTELWHRYARPYLGQFRDVRAMGLLVFGVLVLLVSWSGVQAIQQNFELQKQIAELEQENEVHQLENANLRLRNQYYETDRFLELAARRQFGKAAPGETLLVVPRSVAMAHTADVDVPTPESAQTPPPSAKPWYQRNFEAWLDFFLHRPPSTD